MFLVRVVLFFVMVYAMKHIVDILFVVLRKKAK